VGACGHVPLCQALNVATSQGSNSGGACPVLKAPERDYWELGYDLSQGNEMDQAGRW
jgi:hypothetical protein